MGLNPIAPHLRRLGYDAVSTAKVSLVVQPGDELEVSEDVAAQLLAQSSQFKPIVDDSVRPPVPKRDAAPTAAESADDQSDDAAPRKTRRASKKN